MVILLQVHTTSLMGHYFRNQRANECSGSWSTYLGTYFSVRARALSSLVSPFFCMYVQHRRLTIIYFN